MEKSELKLIEKYDGLKRFCAMYQEMRNAQNTYFSSRKGTRFKTKESNQLLAISKELEANLDKYVEDWINEDEQFLTNISTKQESDE